MIIDWSDNRSNQNETTFYENNECEHFYFKIGICVQFYESQIEIHIYAVFLIEKMSKFDSFFFVNSTDYNLMCQFLYFCFKPHIVGSNEMISIERLKSVYMTFCHSICRRPKRTHIHIWREQKKIETHCTRSFACFVSKHSKWPYDTSWWWFLNKKYSPNSYEALIFFWGIDRRPNTYREINLPIQIWTVQKSDKKKKTDAKENNHLSIARRTMLKLCELKLRKRFFFRLFFFLFLHMFCLFSLSTDGNKKNTCIRFDML